MKRPLKIALIAAAALVLVVLVGAAVLLQRLDGIVKGTVEREGTSQLDLATRLDDADVSVFGGSLALDGLTIANPEGYSAANLFELGRVDVGVSYGDLTGEPVRIKSIDIDAPRLVVERKPGGGLRDALNLNLRELLERLETDPEAETTMLVIDRLTVRNARVVVRPAIEGLKEEYAVTVPTLTLDEIGTAEEAQNGVAIGRAAADVAVALGKKALESDELPPELRAVLSGDFDQMLSRYGDKLKDEVAGQIRGQLDQLGDRVGGEAGDLIDQAAGGDVGGAVEEGRQKVEDEARQRVDEGIKKGLGNLLGGGKDE